jgi:hypothetical protein
MIPYQTAFDLKEWGVVYDDGRVSSVLAGSTFEADGLVGFSVAPTDLKVNLDVGTCSAKGVLLVLSGYPLLSENPEGVEILDQVAQGDFSWAVKPEPKRIGSSASVFLSSSITRDQLADLIGGSYDETRAHSPEDSVWIRWFRSLDSSMIPDPGTDPASRIDTAAKGWGGATAWEVIAGCPQALAVTLNDIAQRHDLAVITVENQFLDRATVLRAFELWGERWAVDWFGLEDVDEDEGEDEPVFQVPLRPGFRLAEPLDEFAIVYDGGGLYTVHATGYVIEEGRYVFQAQTTNGEIVTLGSTPVEGAVNLFRGAPAIADNPDAAPIVQAILDDLRNDPDAHSMDWS